MMEMSDLNSENAYAISFGAETEYFLRAYCAANGVEFSEAICRGLKLLKIAEDGKYRNETMALVKTDEQGRSQVSEMIVGY